MAAIILQIAKIIVDLFKFDFTRRKHKNLTNVNLCY